MALRFVSIWFLLLVMYSVNMLDVCALWWELLLSGLFGIVHHLFIHFNCGLLLELKHSDEKVNWTSERANEREQTMNMMTMLCSLFKMGWERVKWHCVIRCLKILQFLCTLICVSVGGFFFIYFFRWVKYSCRFSFSVFRFLRFVILCWWHNVKDTAYNFAWAMNTGT